MDLTLIYNPIYDMILNFDKPFNGANKNNLLFKRTLY